MKDASTTRLIANRDAYEDARETYLRQFVASGRRYIDEFMGLNCAPDLLIRGFFPNAKEITESSAAYHALKYLPELNMHDPSITVVCPGDGVTPRTAAFFAFRTKWQCISVDPALRKTDWDTERLDCVQKRVEDVRAVEADGPIVIAAVHSHAPLDKAVGMCKTDHQIAIIAIPCCESQRVGDQEPDKAYNDFGIWSPKRQVLIWNNVNTQSK